MRRFLYHLLIIILLLSVNQSVEAQEAGVRKVTGVVIDTERSPVVGASILVKETKKGTVTDMDGKFTISVPADKATLVFSFIGMESETIIVTKQTDLKVVLKNNDHQIGEVVVQGAYGTIQKRSDMVGSAFQVGSKELKYLPAGRVDDMLDGLIPGMRIEPNTDSPSVRTRNNVRIRGDGSLNASSEPMWIVDGVPVYTGTATNIIEGMNTSISPLSFLNPDDIESITVLKDASATAIYGVNASNGVILITTKKGHSGKTVLNATVQYGVSFLNESTRFKTTNGSQYLELAREAWLNGGEKNLDYFPYTDNPHDSYSTTNTNWHDLLFGNGQTLQVNVSASGGSERMSNRLSASYYQEDQIEKGNRQQRITLRSVTNVQIHPKFSSSVTLGVSYNPNNLFAVSKSYYQLLPIFSPYDMDGTTYRLYDNIIDGTTTDSFGNVVPNWKKKKLFNSLAYRDENSDKQRAVQAEGNFSLKYDIIQGLSATVQFGVNYLNNHGASYSARTNWAGMDSNGEGVGYSQREESNVLTWVNVYWVNLDRRFGKHGVNAVAGVELKNVSRDSHSASGSGFMNDFIQEVGYAEQDSRLGSSSSDITRNLSYFFSAGYNWASRYYLTVSGRRDGSSDFGKFARWANSASIGASWNIHNEPFYSWDFMDVLKLKGSYGNTNNSRSSVSAKGAYNYSDSYFYDNRLGAVMSEPPNPGLTWETTYKTNVSIRARFLERFDMELEYYRNVTENMLSKLGVSRAVGSTRIYRNAGSMRNQGVEFNMNTVNIRMKDFEWTTDFNIAHNKNKILELYNDTEVGRITNVWRKGEDKNVYYLVRWAGVDPRDGSPLWYDKNGNITRSFSYDNRVPYKTSSPTVYGGFHNTFRWKDLSLRVNMTYSIGGYLLSSFMSGSLDDGRSVLSYNQPIEALDRWQNPGDLAVNPKFVNNNPSKSSMYSTRYLYKATYFELKNIVLTYNLPKSICKKMNMSGCTLSLIGDNVAIFTPDQKKGKNSYKTLMNGFPMTTTYSVSLGVSF